MSTFRNYSPDVVTTSFAGVTITGFADGTFIEVERDEDAFTHKVGSLGDVVRTKNLNKMGKATLNVLAQHPVNDLLMSIHLADEQFGLSFGPFLVKDLNGTMLCKASVAWIARAPKVERAKESGNVQWVLHFAVVEIFAGGNVI